MARFLDGGGSTRSNVQPAIQYRENSRLRKGRIGAATCRRVRFNGGFRRPRLDRDGFWRRFTTLFDGGSKRRNAGIALGSFKIRWECEAGGHGQAVQHLELETDADAYVGTCSDLPQISAHEIIRRSPGFPV